MVSFVFVVFFALILAFVNRVENLDNKYKQRLLTGILVGISLGWIIGNDED